MHQPPPESGGGLRVQKPKNNPMRSTRAPLSESRVLMNILIIATIDISTNMQHKAVPSSQTWSSNRHTRPWWHRTPTQNPKGPQIYFTA